MIVIDNSQSTFIQLTKQQKKQKNRDKNYVIRMKQNKFLTISVYVKVLVISACGSMPTYSVSSPCKRSVPINLIKISNSNSNSNSN